MNKAEWVKRYNELTKQIKIAKRDYRDSTRFKTGATSNLSKLVKELKLEITKLLKEKYDL